MARKRSGVGNIITIRRMRGLGSINDPKTFSGSALPAFVGAGLTLAAAIATRYWANPAAAEGADTQKALFKWAPLLGIGVGSIMSFAMYYLGGAPAAIATFSGTLASGGGLALHDYVMRNKAGEFALALPPTPTTGVSGYHRRRRGTGVVVPERILGPGVNGIVMEDAASRDPRVRYGATGSYGESAQVSGVNPQAFGTPGFGGR